MYLYRIHIATFLPFRTYNTDNQLIIDTIVVSNYKITKSESYSQHEFYNVWCPKNNLTWNDRFLTPDGSRPIKTRPSVLRDTITDKVGFIENSTKEAGRYELYLPWKHKKGKKPSAHVIIVERQKNGELLWFDPQTARRGKSFNDSLALMIKEQIGVLRIDDKIINPKFASRLLKASR